MVSITNKYERYQVCIFFDDYVVCAKKRGYLSFQLVRGKKKASVPKETHEEREKLLGVVVHQKLHGVQSEQHLARAVARRHVEEELEGLRHNLIIVRPVLQIIPDLVKIKNKIKTTKDRRGESYQVTV